MNAWDIVTLSREPNRPTASYYIERIFTDFVELRGDRAFGDDPALIAGIARLDGRAVTVIAQEKGMGLQDKMYRRFGNANPEGYRKALRQMELAERFGRPIVCLVDTPGAACGIEAEERGQGEAIARNLRRMFSLTVPIVAVVLSEGGSGGALGIAVADEVYMLEYATYSVLSPEGFASILWKDSGKAAAASEVMKITADDLLSLHIIDGIVPEPVPAHKAPEAVCDALHALLKGRVAALCERPTDALLDLRYERFRKF